MLQLSENTATAELQRVQKEASFNDQSLQLARSRADLCEEMARALEERARAGGQFLESEENLRARDAELRREMVYSYYYFFGGGEGSRH